MAKRTIEIRTKIQVEVGSEEEMLWDYLKDKQATPYEFYKMLREALETYWLPLAFEYKQQPVEMVERALEDVAYRWLLHEHYLHRRVLPAHKRVSKRQVVDYNDQQTLAGRAGVLDQQEARRNIDSLDIPCVHDQPELSVCSTTRFKQLPDRMAADESQPEASEVSIASANAKTVAVKDKPAERNEAPTAANPFGGSIISNFPS